MRKVEQQQDQQGFHLNLGEYWRVIWRKKYFIIVPLVISGIVSMVGVRFLVPVYESSSVIRIDNGSGVSQEVARFVQTEGRRTRDAEVLSRLEADLAGSAFLDELIRHLRMDQDPDLLRAAEEQRERLYPGFTTEELVFLRND